MTVSLKLSLFPEQLHQDVQVHPPHIHTSQLVRTVPEGGKLLLRLLTYITGKLQQSYSFLAQLSVNFITPSAPP